MADTTTTVPTNTQAPKEVKLLKTGYFSGMLAGFQVVVFRDLKYAGLDEMTAHKVAIDYGSQLGLAMRNDDNIKTQVSKANKNGQAKLSASFHDRLTMHNALAVYRVVQTIADLHAKERLITGYEVFGVLKLANRLEVYLKECEEWALAQSWEK